MDFPCDHVADITQALNKTASHGYCPGQICNNFFCQAQIDWCRTLSGTPQIFISRLITTKINMLSMLNITLDCCVVFKVFYFT